MRNKFILLFMVLANVLLAQTHLPVLLADGPQKGGSCDLDGSSEYASVTPSLKLTNSYSLQDDFSRGSYSGWTVSSGAYTVDNLVNNPLSTNQYSLKCTTAGIISIPCNQAYGSWEFDLYSVGSNDTYVRYIASNTAGDYGYQAEFNSAKRFAFSRWSTARSALAYSASSYVSAGTWHRVRMKRNTNGSTSFEIKGGSFGSDYVSVNVSGGGGTNPYTDNTYTYSNYFLLSFGVGDRISNIVCTYGEGSLDLNSYEMIKHSFNRGFEATTSLTWAGNGNHSVAQSSTDKKTGTYSLAITSSAAGDATTNYASLASTYFNSIEAGKKYTLEAWARATNANAKLTFSIGGQSKQSATISTVSGTFTKLVWNFQATANEVGVPIKIYANQADVVYLDDVSLSQKYDALASVWVKPSSITSSAKSIIYNNAQFSFSTRSSYNGFYNRYSDGTNTVDLYPTSDYTSMLTNGSWHLINLKIDGTGTSNELYIDGVLVKGATSIATLGKMQATSLSIGNGSAFYAGNIGEVQITRFDDIALSNVNANTLLSAYKNGLPRTWLNGQVMAGYKFKGSTDSVYLRDYSGNNNNLTGTNVTTADFVLGTYPSK